MEKSLKILDAIEEVRQRAAENPSGYPVDYAIRLCCAIVAEEYGYFDRVAWTERLRESEESMYFQRYYGDPGKFHP